jgi:hypothetical protein
MGNFQLYPSSTFPASGDLSTTPGSPHTTVVGLQTYSVSDFAPQSGQVLAFVQGEWTPEAPQSLQGFQGPQGPQGQGPQGFQGPPGSGTQGPQGPSGSGSGGSLIGVRKYAFVYLSGSAAPAGSGDIATATSPTGAVAGIIANRQAASYQYTSASSGSFAGLNGGSTATNAQWVFGRNINFFCEACLGQTVTERMWLGMFDIALSTPTIAGSDTFHANQYAAFRYSTTASDTDWQCVTCDGTTQNVVSSGVAVDTKSHRFLIVINDSIPNATFYIDGTLVATLTTNLPTTSAVNAYYVTGLASTAAVNSDFFWTQVQLQADY